MSSILPGYNYDIFISYRHKDNKHDGWVTEFVKHLKSELDATFKDDISIYFDFNSDDGLLETHNVDKSLEGKLKCLILIPILSQTYCDPRSFAWQHEFCAFNKLTKEDAFGRDITLRNGNVASRILPIRIRELDAEDKSLIETELGSVLRPIDFIYKEQGVNRPLKPEDPEEKNLCHTQYRNQINKTGNAIKEIITALKNPHAGPPVLEETASVPEVAAGRPEKVKPPKKERDNIWYTIRIVAILGLVFYFVFGRGNKSNDDDKEEEGAAEAGIIDKSIAVLPFADLSSGHDQEYFSDGIAEEILNSLAHIPNLKVAGRTSSFQFKGQNTDLKEVGAKLNVGTVLEGSVRKAGNRVRITAQLINVKDGYHIWSETYDRDLTDIFAIQDEVARKIAEVLLKELAAVGPKKVQATGNVKAFEYYLEGKYINIKQFIISGKTEDFQRSEELFKKALALDSNYALAHAGLADLYNTYTSRVKKDPKYVELQEKEIAIAYRLDPTQDYVLNAMGQVQIMQREYGKAYESFVKAIELNPNDGNNMFALAALYSRLGLLEESVIVADHAVRIEPLEANNYFIRGTSKFQLGHFDEAMADLQECLKQQPQNFSALLQMAFLKMIKNDIPEARRYRDLAFAQNPNGIGFTGIDAAIEARLGNKEKALSYPHDFRTYLILGMKKEGVDEMVKTFANIKPPINVYLSLSRSELMTRIGDDPRYRELLAKQKDGFEENKKNFKLPVLPN